MIVGVFKYILGFLLAIAVLLGSGLTIALYFVNRTAIPPERPKFANDNPKPKPDKPKATQVKATPTSTPTPTKSPKSLPAGAYQALVTWPQGLSMRDQPTIDAKSIGGVAANQKVIILETSQDKNWQKIRVEGSDQEGWVKAGNTKKVE
ncbi:SH3 domain-containing protein [Anabaena cylindrica UHCC 0172]|uniref:SH3 domain-containing protein n=1 Tax=Anabaena cylindrica TaxID=1165 RepID=UPI002B219C37|nr:SH3 domain-containing protein [Anabaena cylindrica]MEA5554418.1 SH3 domain-containing protein [Anabaena cylindrica UHCC 0172]